MIALLLWVVAMVLLPIVLWRQRVRNENMDAGLKNQAAMHCPHGRLKYKSCFDCAREWAVSVKPAPEIRGYLVPHEISEVVPVTLEWKGDQEWNYQTTPVLPPAGASKFSVGQWVRFKDSGRLVKLDRPEKCGYFWAWKIDGFCVHDGSLEPAVPRLGEWWQWIHSPIPFLWTQDLDVTNIGGFHQRCIEVGHLVPVNFGKGY